VAGDSTNVRDGQFFLWLAGIGPAILFLVLEKLRRTGRSERSEKQNVVLALLLAFGTVYFFTSLQGTVWFAAHVVGVAVAALYVLFALDAERPWLAGALIGMGFLTRTPLLFAVPLFLYEAVRSTAREPSTGDPVPSGLGSELRSLGRRVAFRPLLARCAAFAVPIAACMAFTLWHNQARFGDPFNHGYEFLTVAWQARMKKWGLFDYHYLARNLGVVLTSLPWRLENGPAPFQINAHGLAIWFTTPLYLWLLWPKRVRGLELALYASALAVALPGLFYQNTGWIQFGYRFSNDYAVFLFVLLALTNRPMRFLFFAAALWSIAVNAFGAATFDRGQFKKFYYEDRSQKVLYQPD
jgi:hypothetical protein